MFLIFSVFWVDKCRLRVPHFQMCLLESLFAYTVLELILRNLMECDQTKTIIIEIGQRRLVAPNLASYSNFRQHRFSAVD